MKKNETLPPVDKVGQLTTALREHFHLTSLAKEAKAEADSLRDNVIVPLAEDLGRKSATFVSAECNNVQVTIPAPGERIKVDEAKLKKALGAALWAKVTTPALDAAKLDAWLNQPGLPETERLARHTMVQAATTKSRVAPSPRYKVLGPAEPEREHESVPVGTVPNSTELISIIIPEFPAA